MKDVGIFCGHLVYIFQFWYVVPRKIWQLWGRCYDHNFLRLMTIFGENIGVFLKNQCYDQNFA
jgi:hypothetical protein